MMKWTKEDYKTLIRLVKEGKSCFEIAVEMGRTYGAINNKLSYLGLHIKEKEFSKGSMAYLKKLIGEEF
jgi:hypothetical protein